jgi:DNA repair protein RadC
VHPREVFSPAIRDTATAVVVAHNHPSGDPTPSPEDRAVTDRLRAAGELVGIELVDHLVVGVERYYSFAEESFFVVPAA